MANDPETLIVTVSQGNRRPVHRVIQTPSQYRAFTPKAPPIESTRTRAQASKIVGPPIPSHPSVVSQAITEASPKGALHGPMVTVV